MGAFLQKLMSKPEERERRRYSSPARVDGTAREKPPKEVEEPPTELQKILAALFYAISSLLVIFINKMVLTSYGFPSFHFLALCQFVTTALVIYTCKLLGKMTLTHLNWETFFGVLPLATLFLLNVVSGLGGTKQVSLPMFTVMRRFSILITMLLEQLVLSSQPSFLVKVSVGLMLLGAVVAALNDLSFNLYGYTMIMANNVFTASYGVALKRATNSQSLSKMSLLFYNSVFSAMIIAVIIASPYGGYEEIREYERWTDRSFALTFILASCMGSVLNYSIFLCTHINSALTTTVVGCLKNVLTAYLGMLFGGDYIFSWPNFVGLNISIAGSLVYSWADFSQKGSRKVERGGRGDKGSLLNGSSHGVTKPKPPKEKDNEDEETGGITAPLLNNNTSSSSLLQLLGNKVSPRGKPTD